MVELICISKKKNTESQNSERDVSSSTPDKHIHIVTYAGHTQTHTYSFKRLMCESHHSAFGVISPP